MAAPTKRAERELIRAKEALKRRTEELANSLLGDLRVFRVIGTLVGISLIFSGVSRFMLSMAIRRTGAAAA